MQVLSDVAPVALSDAEVTSARPALIAVPDRAAREAAAALARREYCAHLKEVRERRGITLTEIAARSKVSESLYAGLERADVSRWPAGIYRRSFFREYASALGLPVDHAVSEFVELFPDESEQPSASPLPMPAGPMRMSLAGHTWLRVSRIQLVASLVDIVMVAAITIALAWWMPIHAGTVAAIVAAIYYSIATAALACSPGLWWLRTRSNRRRAKALRLAR